MDNGVGGWRRTNPSFPRIFGIILNWQNPLLEVVYCGSETQLQVIENLNWISQSSIDWINLANETMSI